MSSPKIAAQLYTIRDYIKKSEDIKTSLKKVRDMGYRAVQVSGMGPIDPKELKDIVDSLGITICATHIPFERMEEDIHGVIEEHKIWDCKYVGLGSMPQEFRGSREGVIEFIHRTSKISDILTDNGLKFIYHNHAFEFVKFDGKTTMDILLEETDENFGFEIDTYWVQAGGGNPVDWIYKVRGRMDVVHFKDMGVDINNKQIMKEVGEGNLNWPEIIQACKETDVKWCAVEQDICEGSPFDSLNISFNNLRELGLGS